MASKTSTTRSGDPRKKAAAKAAVAQPAVLEPTSADAWVSKTVGGDDEDIRLPSGNVARVRRVGPEAFLTQDLMPDTITPIVEKAIKSKKGLRPQQQADMVRDPKQLGAMMEMLDRTLVYAVVEPRVVMPPTCIFDYRESDGESDPICGKLNNAEHPDDHDFVEGERDPDLLYADKVDLDDKMFILNFVAGGSRDLERFRREHRAGVASLPSVEGS